VSKRKPQGRQEREAEEVDEVKTLLSGKGAIKDLALLLPSLSQIASQTDFSVDLIMFRSMLSLVCLLLTLLVAHVSAQNTTTSAPNTTTSAPTTTSAVTTAAVTQDVSSTEALVTAVRAKSKSETKEESGASYEGGDTRGEISFSFPSSYHTVKRFLKVDSLQSRRLSSGRHILSSLSAIKEETTTGLGTLTNFESIDFAFFFPSCHS
jgi:hypothetical protein